MSDDLETWAEPFDEPDGRAVEGKTHRRPDARASRRRSGPLVVAAGLAVVTLVAASIAVVDNGGRPSGLSAPDATSASSAAVTTPARPTERIELPPLDAIVSATLLYAHRFPWGTDAPGSVGFMAGHQGAPVGPAAFSTDGHGDVRVFDLVNDRFVDVVDGGAGPTSSTPISASIQLTLPTLIDAAGRMIAGDGTGGLVVVARDGASLGRFPKEDFPAVGGSYFSQLTAEGGEVSVWTASGEVAPVLQDDGTGYRPLVAAAARPPAISIIAGRGNAALSAGERSYLVYASRSIASVRASRLIDGTIVAVLGLDVTPPLQPGQIAYLLLRIAADGSVGVARVAAPNYYMDTGPLFQLGDDFFAVMSDTERDGVTVVTYAYPKSTTKAVAVGACKWRASVVDHQGATGRIVASIDLQNTSSQTCELPSEQTVSGVLADGSTVSATFGGELFGWELPPSVLVRAGGHATLNVAADRTETCQLPSHPTAELEITLTDGTDLIVRLRQALETACAFEFGHLTPANS